MPQVDFHADLGEVALDDGGHGGVGAGVGAVRQVEFQGLAAGQQADAGAVLALQAQGVERLTGGGDVEAAQLGSGVGVPLLVDGRDAVAGQAGQAVVHGVDDAVAVQHALHGAAEAHVAEDLGEGGVPGVEVVRDEGGLPNRAVERMTLKGAPATSLPFKSGTARR